MKLTKTRHCVKQTNLLRTIKIRNGFYAFSFLFPLVSVTLSAFYAYTVYTQSINDKLERSNEQALYLLNQNFITELNIFRMYIDTISVSDECQQILSKSCDTNFTLNEQDVQALNDFHSRVPFPSIHLKNLRILDRNRNIVYDLGYDDIDAERFSQIVEEIDETPPAKPFNISTPIEAVTKSLSVVKLAVHAPSGAYWLHPYLS